MKIKIIGISILIVLLLGQFIGSTQGSSIHQSNSTNLASIELPWNLEAINAADAWEITMGSEEIVVAIVDSGIYWNTSLLPHSTRWQNTVEITGIDGVDDDGDGYIDDYYGWDYVDSDNDTSVDQSGWPITDTGTSYAGIIASPHVSEPFGIAPNVKIMDVRILDSAGSLAHQNSFFKAIEYAMFHNASIVVGAFKPIQPLSIFDINLIREAYESGIALVLDSGSDSSVISPYADFRYFIAVSAIDNNNSLLPNSGKGPELDLTAPGYNISTINKSGGVRYITEAPTASAHVAGTIALMQSVRNDFPTEYIRKVLQLTAFDLYSEGRDSTSGYGLLDTAAAVQTWKNFEQIDIEGDGMPSDYELRYGFDPFEDDGSEDPDFDGKSNLEEYLGGTDPREYQEFVVTTVTSNVTQSDVKTQVPFTYSLSLLAFPTTVYVLQKRRKWMKVN